MTKCVSLIPQQPVTETFGKFNTKKAEKSLDIPSNAAAFRKVLE